MDADEDMIVVIIGDEDGSVADSNFKPEIKQEVMDIEDLLEAVEKHGKVFDIGTNIKEEPEDESEYLDSDGDEDYVPDENEDVRDDDEFIPDEEYELEIPKRKNKKNKREVYRKRMLDKAHQNSFVQDLITQYPELGENNKLLIETLYQVMKNVKVPVPPLDYYSMNGDMFECVKCGAQKDTLPAVGRHYQEKHGQRYLMCYACGADFRSTTNLYKHEKRCTAPDAVVVLKARARFVGVKGRSRPFLPKRSELTKCKREYRPAVKGSFLCSECPAVFTARAGLQAHAYKHTGERPYKCGQCAAAYTSRTALGRHTMLHTGLEFICDHCQRSFKVKATLAAHMNTHLPQKKYACDECGKRYAQNMALQLHVRRAHRLLPPPCACRLCPRRYPRMSLLKSHMMREHGMLLMTRNMFFKRLPTMSEEELKQAKLILKSEAEAASIYSEDNGQNDYTTQVDHEIPHMEEDNEEHSELDETEDVKYESNEKDEGGNVTHAQDTEFSSEALEYVQKLHMKGEIYKDAKVVIIENGKVVSIDGTGVDIPETYAEVEGGNVERLERENEAQEESNMDIQLETDVESAKDKDKRKQTFLPRIDIEIIPNEVSVAKKSIGIGDKIIRNSKKKKSLEKRVLVINAK